MCENSPLHWKYTTESINPETQNKKLESAVNICSNGLPESNSVDESAKQIKKILKTSGVNLHFHS